MEDWDWTVLAMLEDVDYYLLLHRGPTVRARARQHVPALLFVSYLCLTGTHHLFDWNQVHKVRPSTH